MYSINFFFTLSSSLFARSSDLSYIPVRHTDMYTHLEQGKTKTWSWFYSAGLTREPRGRGLSNGSMHFHPGVVTNILHVLI